MDKRIEVQARYCELNANLFDVEEKTFTHLEPGIYRAKSHDYGVGLKKEEMHCDTVRISNEMSQEIIDQIIGFWSMEKEFNSNGIVHKRGFLLVGPPGCGKTSIITEVIMDSIKTGCIVFKPRKDWKFGEDVTECLKKVKLVEPNKKILVVMEDFETYTRDEEDVSAWLNILDGINSVNNVIFLATSNYPEEIDTRFTSRPSRFDSIYIVNPPVFEDRLMYIKAKRKELTNEEAGRIASDTHNMSYAFLKELLVSTYIFKKNYESVLERLKKHLENPISSKDFETPGGRRKIGFGRDDDNAPAVAAGHRGPRVRRFNEDTDDD